jgi:stress response protein YsnF
MNTAMQSGFAWFDMMLNFQQQMQRSSYQSVSSYSPTAGASISARLPRENGIERVVPVGEERLNVATRTVPGETTRIRRRVVEQPVEQQVTLREEKVVVERRPSTGKPLDTNLFTETVVEMSDSREVPTVWKSLHVSEEVVLRMQVTERTEKVRDTVRRDVVEVDHARKDLASPAQFAAKVATFQEKAAETREQLAALRHAADGEDRKDEPRHTAADVAPQVEGPKPDDASGQPGRRKN